MRARGKGSSPGRVEGSSRAMLVTARPSCWAYYGVFNFIVYNLFYYFCCIALRCHSVAKWPFCINKLIDWLIDCAAPFVKKCPFPWGNLGPHLMHRSLGSWSTTPIKRHLDRVSRFSTMHASYQRTDRSTDNDEGTRPVKINRLRYVGDTT